MIDVSDGATGELVGRIRDPCSCCDMTFTVEDRSGGEVFAAKGGICQPGVLCPCPCGPCREVHFPVKDSKNGQPVGKLTKIVPSCLKFMVADNVDNYEIDFGSIEDPQHKALMIALGLFIDFRHFNTRSDTSDGPGDGDAGVDAGDVGGDL